MNGRLATGAVRIDHPGMPTAVVRETEAPRGGERPVATYGLASARAEPAKSSRSARVFFLDHPLTETMLVTDAAGAVYIGISCANEHDNGAVLRTRDRGERWQRLVPELPGGTSTGRALNASMGTLTLDRHSGRLFATSLGDSSCAIDNPWAEKIAKLMRRSVSWSDTLAYSDDQGESWHVVQGQFKDGGDWGKTFVGPAATAASRAALAHSDYPSVVYHCAGATFSETSYCWKSLDGGKSFARTRSPVFSSYMGRTPLPYGGASDPPAGGERAEDQHTLSGVGVVASDGTVYIPANICGHARLYLSDDEGDSWSCLPLPFARARSKKSHESVTGFQDPPNAGRPLLPQQPFHALYGSTAMSALWSQQIAIDRQDTLYLSWVDALDDLPYLAWSRDRGRSWSRPVMVAPPGVNMASISALAVREPGEVAIAFYASRDAGMTFDGMLTLTENAFDASPSFEHAQTNPSDPIQYNRLSEPCEYVGVAFAPDGTAWASFARDTHLIDPSSDARQCDGNFRYNGERFRAVVLRLG